MLVYLVRHGKAEPAEEFPGADKDRPLKKRGERQARRLAEHLALEVTPEERPVLIVTSRFKRALQTARIIRDVLDVPLRESAVLEFGHSAGEAADFVRGHATRDGEEGPVMFVGHNPQLEEVLGLLAPGARGSQREMRTGEAAVVEAEGGGLLRKLRFDDE